MRPWERTGIDLSRLRRLNVTNILLVLTLVEDTGTQQSAPHRRARLEWVLDEAVGLLYLANAAAFISQSAAAASGRPA